MNLKTLRQKSGSENSVIVIILAVLLVLVLAIVGIYLAKDNQAIVKFDGGKVTKSEYKIYYQMFSTYLSYYGYDKDSIPDAIATKAATDKMILTDAKAAGVKITDEDKAEVDKIFDDESYINYFTQQGFDIDKLKQIYYNDYIIQDYIEKLASEASNDEVEAYIKSQNGDDVDMNEYDTSHILFSFTKDDGTTMSDDEKAELKAKAEEVLQRALNGEDFATLAQENSDDTGTASNGGEYKVYMDGNTVDAYADVVKTMQAGQVYGELVESSYGYHIIKLNAINEGGRVNNETEREEYANTKFDNIATEKNMQIDEDALKKFVEEIDPSSTSDDSSSTDTTTTTTTDDTTSTDTTTTTTDGE